MAGGLQQTALQLCSQWCDLGGQTWESCVITGGLEQASTLEPLPLLSALPRCPSSEHLPASSLPLFRSLLRLSRPFFLKQDLSLVTLTLPNFSSRLIPQDHLELTHLFIVGPSSMNMSLVCQDLSTEFIAVFMCLQHAYSTVKRFTRGWINK